MKIRWTHGRTALRGIALVLAFTSLAMAQNGPEQDDPTENEQAECMPSRAPHECPDRCPDYDTCLVADEQLYYQVGEQRFECEGFDCAVASVALGDYCCRRGEYAPDSDGGGGCTVASEERDSAVAGGAVALGALATLAAWRKRSASRRSGRPRR